MLKRERFSSVAGCWVSRLLGVAVRRWCWVGLIVLAVLVANAAVVARPVSAQLGTCCCVCNDCTFLPLPSAQVCTCTIVLSSSCDVQHCGTIAGCRLKGCSRGIIIRCGNREKAV